jgi:hypothetical protein
VVADPTVSSNTQASSSSSWQEVSAEAAKGVRMALFLLGRHISFCCIHVHYRPPHTDKQPSIPGKERH